MDAIAHLLNGTVRDFSNVKRFKTKRDAQAAIDSLMDGQAGYYITRIINNAHERLAWIVAQKVGSNTLYMMNDKSIN